MRRDHEVTGLDALASPLTDIVGSITDPTLLRRALHRIDAVIHTAALHAPHVGTVPDAVFNDVNVTATRVLAEIAVTAGVQRFVFTSTTALYGVAATSGAPAAWVNEDLEPQPATIYHRSKLAAERQLRELTTERSLAVTVLRMSRCFPEPAPQMAVYRLHRGVDARDVAEAHALALRSATPGFRQFVVSGATPFTRDDLQDLARDAPIVLQRRAPELAEAFARRGWTLPATIDRVYSPARAMHELGWRPRYDFAEVLEMLARGSPEVLPPR
jgi:nucleoside-diphosphate-sugar epimerase